MRFQLIRTLMNVGPSLRFALAAHNGPHKFVQHSQTQSGSAMNCWARATKIRHNKALHRSTLVLRLFNVFSFVYASWLFNVYLHWAACPVTSVVSPPGSLRCHHARSSSTGEPGHGGTSSPRRVKVRRRNPASLFLPISVHLCSSVVPLDPSRDAARHPLNRQNLTYCSRLMAHGPSRIPSLLYCPATIRGDAE